MCFELNTCLEKLFLVTQLLTYNLYFVKHYKGLHGIKRPSGRLENSHLVPIIIQPTTVKLNIVRNIGLLKFK